MGTILLEILDGIFYFVARPRFEIHSSLISILASFTFHKLICEIRQSYIVITKFKDNNNAFSARPWLKFNKKHHNIRKMVHESTEYKQYSAIRQTIQWQNDQLYQQTCSVSHLYYLFYHNNIVVDCRKAVMSLFVHTDVYFGDQIRSYTILGINMQEL